MSETPPTTPPSQDDTNTTAGREWEGYSDYQYISYQIASSIQDAIDSYARLQSLHDESAKVRAEHAASARRPILAAAMNLLPELEHNQNSKEIYERMVADWTESGVEDDTGYIEALRSANLQVDCPDWLYDFVSDMRKAGWELGYLQAGRYQDDEEDDAEASAREMLEDIVEAK
jgi:hypothetical protein